MAIVVNDIMKASLNKELVRETEARGDLRRTIGHLTAAQVGTDGDIIPLARVKWNSMLSDLRVDNLGILVAGGTAQIGVWAYNPDIALVDAAGHLNDEAIQDLDTLGSAVSTAGGLLTGPSCIWSTVATGAALALPLTTLNGTSSWIHNVPLANAAIDTNIVKGTVRRCSFKQIVMSLLPNNADNTAKLNARKQLFAGMLPYSNVDCLLVMRLGTALSAGGPYEYTATYVEGTVSNMVNMKTSPAYP